MSRGESRAGRRCVGFIPGTFQLMAILTAVFYAAASNNNGAAYLLGFALLGLFLVGVVQGVRNLGGVAVRVIDVADGVASRGDQPGEGARVRVALHQAGGAPCYGLVVSLPEYPGEAETVSTVIPEAMEEAAVGVPILPRGIYRVERVEVKSLFPFGFVRIARFFQVLPHEFAIYPAPVAGARLPAGAMGVSAEGGLQTGGDDFVGVRNYQEGESQRHVDWKAVSRGHPMMVKQFGGGVGQTLVLQWDETEGDREDRLGVLAWWVQELERQGHRYGLALPQGLLEPGQGAGHLQRCLRWLAAAPGASSAKPKRSRLTAWWKGGRR